MLFSYNSNEQRNNWQVKGKTSCYDSICLDILGSKWTYKQDAENKKGKSNDLNDSEKGQIGRVR